MALAKQTMTDEQRKSVAIEYLKAFDNAGVTSSGGSILELFATDAQVSPAVSTLQRPLQPPGAVGWASPDQGRC